MSWLRTFQTGMRGILSHRLRSALTTLGILFGVAAVICTVGIGQASSDAVTSRISALGTNLITISPGSTGSGGVRGGAGTSSTLTLADANALANPVNAPDLSAVAPVVQRSEAMVAGASTWTATTTGTSPGWLLANARTLSDGSFFTDTDVSHRNDVVILGATTAANLGVAVGDPVTIGHIPFTVIGILTSSGSSGLGNADDLAVVPITTAQDEFTGGSASVQRILLSASSQAVLGSAYTEANQLLLQTHHIPDPAQADFTVATQSQILSTAEAVTGTLTVLLASVAAIALLVGGIGVMNIMLVSVTERTSEIGLRKALGAAPRDLLRQFLIEAAVLSVFGGLLGVLAGIGVAWVLPKLTTVAVAISLPPILIAVAVSAAIGLVFGVFPALRAARMPPIEALRSQ